MLLEEGFKLTSVDLSDKMLKYALKTRWKRRKEPAFDDWGKEVLHPEQSVGHLYCPFSVGVNSFMVMLKRFGC